jgi:hypothetical protein
VFKHINSYAANYIISLKAKKLHRIFENYGYRCSVWKKAITEGFQQSSMRGFGIVSGIIRKAKTYRRFSGLEMKLEQQKRNDA